MTGLFRPDPRLDLVFERVIDTPPERVWECWTRPEHLLKWFVPAPWSLAEAEVDLRPGGVFRTVMRSPEGQLFPNLGCYLDVVPHVRLAWTDALLPGFRPSEKPFFTGMIQLEPEGAGTRYFAMAIHRDEEGRNQHAAMNFAEGWGKALDQLVAHAATL